MSRLRRKDDHIRLSLRSLPGRADFSNIHFINNCLPELDLDTVSLKTHYLGRTFRSPLFINAVTGGTKLAGNVNAGLAEVAAELEVPMAVGSQTAALEMKAAEESFRIVRRINPRGEIWANTGSYADPDSVRRAVEMIEANAVQIHLNVPQELAMREGECRFAGLLGRIEAIVKSSEVPVVVKEVGFGIAAEEAKKLIDAGVKAVDVGGRGGTDFLAIEKRRSKKKTPRAFQDWGIPTALSLIEVLEAVRGRANVFAAGGMRESIDIARALALGADAVGLAGLPLHILMKKGPRALLKKMRAIEHQLRQIMMMTGASTVADLRGIPLVITGLTAEWMERRGIDPSGYARRAGKYGQ